MVNEKMRDLGARRSVIRELFEYGKKRKAEIGAENVFDFSIGNPSVPAPDAVNESLLALIREKDPVALHGYTSAQGDAGVRRAIADYIETTHGEKADPDLIYLTVGAAASLTVSLTAILEAGDEVILLAPFFPEYRVFVERTGAHAVPVLCDTKSFQPDFEALEAAITEKTRAIIVNSPNNPTGAVLTRESIECLAALLTRKSETYGNPIYLIADEPYRELVYGDVEVPYLPSFYPNTLVCYSFSKSVSLPGERIGYILVSPTASEAVSLYQAVCGAGRALGFVCAPALFQYMIPYVLGLTSDLTVYDTNRKLLYDALTSYGYEVVKPDGAFYLFVKALEPDANAFCEAAKKEELLLVASDSFGCPGYVRISYCVTTEQIERSLPAFERLAKTYGVNK
ncbi:MAG: pyridoxal phosphate-dependent aminotransferase [Ruminococcaceae bacterium]|nr:pyridoxal phosphate-dependent aminotransferase [Oscillospiraceae bacterium]